MKNSLGRYDTVLVLGGNSDIAIATVGELIASGTTEIVLAGRDESALERRAAAIRSDRVHVTTTCFDAADIATHASFIDEVWRGAARDIDLVIFAFGALGDQSNDERDSAAAAEVITIGFTGAASLGVAVAERLREQGHGAIVALSSVAGERVRRANFIYGSAKAGMDAFFLGLGEALHDTGVHVLVVRPGFVHTKMTAGMPAAPLAVDATRVARDIVNGLRRGAEVIWSPPAMRVVMSILRHVPRVVFRRLPI